MNIRAFFSTWLPSAPALISLSIGVLAGLGILVVAEKETRWLIYVSGGCILATIAFMIRDREWMLWNVFILSIQMNVSFRIMHGYAGSNGFVFPLTTLVAFALVGWYVASGKIDDLKPIKWGGPLAFPVAALFTTGFLSTLDTSSQFVSLSSFFLYLQYYLIYLLALNCVTSENQLYLILKLLFAVLAIQSGIYYIQSAFGITFTPTGAVSSAGGLPRPGGTVSTNPQGFAVLVIPLLFLSIAHSISSKPVFRHRWLITCIVVLGLGALLLTYTRAAWAGFLLGGAWLFLIGYKRKIFSTRTMFLVCICAAFLSVLMLAYSGKRGSVSGAYDERFALMQMAMNVIREHPFNGVGIGVYDHVFKGYLTQELANRWVWKVHNTYLLTVAETGFVGGLALVFFLFSVLRLSLRVSRSDRPILQVTAVGCSAGIISLCFIMYWEALDGYHHNVLFWFLFGVMAAADTERIRSDDG